MRKLIAIMLVSVLVCTCFTGCTKSTSSQTEVQEEEKIRKIAMSIPIAAAPYWTGVAYGVEKAIEEINQDAGKTVVELQFFDPGVFSLESQLKNIEDAVAMGFDGMVIAPVDVEGTVPAIEMAYNSGVPIFTVDIVANTDAVLVGYCTYNYEAGCTNAEKMAELIFEKNGAYKGKVAMNLGQPTISSHIQRAEGFKDTMKNKYPDIEIIFEKFAIKPEENLLVAEDALAMYGEELDAIFVTGDSAANYTCQAIDNAGLFKPIGDSGHIIVVGFDGESLGINNIKNGRQDATVAQNPINMGYLATLALYDYITTGNLPDVDEDGLVEVPHFAIDYKNINEDEASEFMWAEIVESLIK